MTGGEVIYAALTAGSPLTAGELKVRQDAADQDDPYPFIVFRRVVVDRMRGLDGSLHATRETFHIECWGETRAQSDLLEAQALSALESAGLYPDGNEVDGLDPEVLVKAAVFAVDVWS